jgi:FkbM family methyltransferase
MQAGIKRLVKSALNRASGAAKEPASGFHAEMLDPFLLLLKRLNFAPRHIIDVGANRGDWTRTARRVFPDTRYTLLEPQEHLRVYMRDLIEGPNPVELITAGAAEQPGILTLTLATRDDSSTFALSQQEAAASGARQIPVEVKTLNQIVADSTAGMPDMVKIDAEGLDLRVLGGASDLLGRTEIFLIEAAICAPLKNSLSEVLGFMSGAGYKLMDITDLNRSPQHGALWLCEGAFVRNGSPLLDGIRSYE